MRTLIFRLKPGADLKSSIEAMVRQHAIKAGFIITCVGGLEQATVRMAGAKPDAQDIVRREMLRVRDRDNNPSVQLIYDLAMYGHKIGFDVIIEGIFVSARYGEMLRQLIADFKGEPYVYYFDVPLEVTLQRHSLKPNAHEFGEKELREWWVEKDYLNVPSEKRITADMNESQIGEMFVSDIKFKTKSHADYVQ